MIIEESQQIDSPTKSVNYKNIEPRIYETYISSHEAPKFLSNKKQNPVFDKLKGIWNSLLDENKTYSSYRKKRKDICYGNSDID